MLLSHALRIETRLDVRAPRNEVVDVDETILHRPRLSLRLYHLVHQPCSERLDLCSQVKIIAAHARAPVYRVLKWSALPFDSSLQRELPALA